MTMEQLHYFLSVARHRNFTEAAEEFYLTQPAITHQISALKQELGIKLLHRTTRSVSLTRTWELFLEDAKRMLDLEERVRERMRQVEHSSTPVLEVGYLNSPSRHFLPQLVRRFQEQYPQARVKLYRRTPTASGRTASRGPMMWRSQCCRVCRTSVDTTMERYKAERPDSGLRLAFFRLIL